MVGGIVFQLFSITIFVICAADFVRRTLTYGLLERVTGTIAPLFAAMIFSVLCIYARSIYRTIELAQGWDGYLITNERYFIALDGAMMVAAVAVFNVFHPGWLSPQTIEGNRESVDKDSQRAIFSRSEGNYEMWRR